MQADGTALPFPDATFDAVHASWLLEHVPDPARVVAEVHRVLKPGGVCRFIEVDNRTLLIEPSDADTVAVLAAADQAQIAAGGDPFIGPKLEKRQVLLGRIADIGTDLFAIAATCIFAQKLISDGEAADKVLMLTDDFHAQARLRIDQNCRGIGRNADQHGYDLAQQVINGDHQWVEHGIV